MHQRCPPASRGHGIPGGQLCYASASGDSLGPRRLSLAILARGDRNRTTSGKEEVTHGLPILSCSDSDRCFTFSSEEQGL